MQSPVTHVLSLSLYQQYWINYIFWKYKKYTFIISVTLKAEITEGAEILPIGVLGAFYIQIQIQNMFIVNT